MATSSAHTRRPLADASGEHGGWRSGAGHHAPFGPALALTVTLTVACVAALMSALLLVVHPDVSIASNRFGDQQNQNAKTLLYLVAFAIVLPSALVAVPRLTDAIATGPNGKGLGVLSGALAALLAVAILLVKASNLLPWGDGLGVLLVAVGIWWAVAVTMLARARRPTPWTALTRFAGRGLHATGAAGALGIGSLLCLTSLPGHTIAALGVGALVGAAVLFVYARRRLPEAPRPWGLVLDVVIAVLVALAIPDMVVFTTSSAPINPFFPPGIIQFHHDFLLGPANQVLAGGALLVNDPVSQYGVGIIYFLAGWFQIAPIGYGTYGMLDGILTALFYVAAYGVLRVVCVRRLLAASAMGVAVVALIYSLHYPVGALPQQGPLRFGLPMLVILATVPAVRWPHRARAARAVALVVVGVSAIWALEAFAYTVFTFAGMLTLQAWLRPAGARLRWVARQILLGIGACICAQLILAVATLAGTGQLPHWSQYLAYVHAFVLGGKAGEVTYGFEPWSPGLALAAAYLASAAALALIVRRRADVVKREPALVVGLAGMTAYGIALFSYTDNRSSTYLLPYVALPALVAGTLWLSLLLRSPQHASRRIRLAGLAIALSVGVILVAASFWSVGERFPRSALAKAHPGGGLRAAVSRLWHPPPIDPRAPDGERLLRRYMPGQRRSLVLLPASPDLATEILMRTGRANTLPLGDPKADSFVPSVWTPILRRSITRLAAGDRLLLDDTARRAFSALVAHPHTDPLVHPLFGGNPLDEWILQRIGTRFRLRPIVRDRTGYTVAEIVTRS